MAIRTTAVVLVCAIAIGAAAAGFVAAGVPLSAPSGETVHEASEQSANRSLKTDVEIHANREAKDDRLILVPPVAPVVPAVRFANRPATPGELMHESFAAIAMPQTPLARYTALPPVLPDAEPLPGPKSPIDDIRNPLLNDAQIESIRKRLKLTPAQDRLWPAVRSALHDVILAHAARQKKARRGESVALDPASAEIGRLKAAALPLLAQLRADQKRELNMLAHIIGLGSALARL